MMRLWRQGTAMSRFGWPVPRIAKAVSPREMSMLLDTANSSGFSRNGKGVVVQKIWSYYLLPYLYESSPVSCWMCVVVVVKKSTNTTGAKRVELHYARLDVATEEFRRLPNAAAADRDQLLHWVLWDAAKIVDDKRDSDNRTRLSDDD